MPLNQQEIMQERLEHIHLTVKEDGKGKRLDAFLVNNLESLGLSREKLKAIIKDGAVFVDGKVVDSPSEKLLLGAIVEVVLPDVQSEIKAEEGELLVVYQDTELAIIDKPANLTVHPCPSCPDGTLVNRLLSYFPNLAKQDNPRPGIVHRLDKDTSGILLVALTERCRLKFAELFAAREIHKEYLAIVYGVPKNTAGEIDIPIGRHPQKKVMMAVSPSGKEAQSRWRVLYADPEGFFSVLAVRIMTGRTHQIRVHLSHIGHPIIGDSLYVGAGKHQQANNHLRSCYAKPQRQMLHAAQIAFEHPFPEVIPDKLPENMERLGDSLRCTLPPPKDFFKTLVELTIPHLRVVITGLPGCGKSALLQMLAATGLPVSSADEVVKKLYEPEGDAWRLLKARFGEMFFSPAGTKGKNAEQLLLDREKLGNAMQANPLLRKEVEAIVHPLVAHAHKVFFEENEKNTVPVSIVEIPLYFEAGYHLNNELQDSKGNRPILIGVHCATATRHIRLKEGRRWGVEKITAIEAWQWPEDKKMQACDVVIDNSGTKDELAAQAQKLVIKLHALQSQKAEAIITEISKKLFLG